MSPPSETDVRLSVVTATRSGSVRLPELIDSLNGQDIDVEWEWVVVLDGVTDQTPWVLQTLAKDLPVRVVHLDEPHGVSAALAAGYNASAAPLILRCDDDLTLPPHLLSGHLAHHATIDHPVGVISMTRDVFDSRFGDAYGRRANEALLRRAYSCPPGQRWRHWAACNSIRRSDYDSVGGFDTRLTYREDSDLGYRLHRAGVRIVVDPGLEVLHRGAFTHARSRVERAFTSGASQRLFEQSHPETSGADDPEGLWSRAVGLTAQVVPSPSAAARLGNAVDVALPVLPDRIAEKAVALAVEAAGTAGRARGRPEWTRSSTPHRRSIIDRVAARLAVEPGPLDSVVGSIVGVATDSPEIVLTYDDGPTPGVTDRLLDVLDRHGQSATFFVLANRAEASPHLLREMQAAGHEIALHGPDHRRLTQFTLAEVQRRTQEARDRIEDICGTRVSFFRPPYGAQGLRAWAAVRRSGLSPVLWSASFDEQSPESQDERLERLLRQCHPGTVVLAHDGYAGPADGVDDGPEPLIDRVRLTDEFLRRVGEGRLRATSLTDALTRGTPVARAWLRR